MPASRKHALPGKVTIISPGDARWRRKADAGRSDRPYSASAGIAAMAAVVALATVAGALGGALATAASGIPAAMSRDDGGATTALWKPRSRGSMPISWR